MARTLASVELGFATATDEGVQLHQYGSYRVSTGDVVLEVETEYPSDGEIVVRVLEGGEFTLSLRIPPFARGSALLDGASVDPALSVVTVRLSAGDVVRLSLPMTARFVTPHPRIDAARGQVAVERGPFVLALESVDLPDGLDTEHVVVDASVAPVATPDGARVALERREATGDGWPYDVSARIGGTFEAEYRPYYRWANRGPSTMRIWTPTS
ncbi:hypothetical protein [Rathayibacter oskolensis]|uniref:hypothetical protein n=1 Tax=Rathayibacter oskolensis TaxID=1891671 RepID=UPI003465DF4D